VTRTLDVEGLSTCYVDVGDGEPVLILHGWGASGGAVAPIVQAMSRNRRAISVDLPGFGGTDGPPRAWGTSDYATWVSGFITALKLSEPAIIGHSFGGRLAIRLAVEHGIGSRLVLVDAAGVPPRRGFRYYRRVATAKGMRLATRPFGRAGSRVQQAVSRRMASTDYAAAGALRPTFVKVVSEDLRPLLPDIAVPSLLVWGSMDEETPLWQAHVMERLIPDAGLVVLEGAGHYSYLDQAARFARIVEHFLDSTKSGASEQARL
jgi:pimeloyl-ACP methyl ester carboxylesterase